MVKVQGMAEEAVEDEKIAKVTSPLSGSLACWLRSLDALDIGVIDGTEVCWCSSRNAIVCF